VWSYTDPADTVRLSTTVATNALLERRGAPHALLITKGFKDLLSIGNQARPKIFDLHIKKASTLYGDVVEVDERVTLVGYTSDPEHAAHAVKWTEDGQVAKAYEGIGAQNGLGGSTEGSIVQGLSGEAVHILKKLDQDVVRADLQKLYNQGYRSVAVVLAHSYVFKSPFKATHADQIALRTQTTSSKSGRSPKRSVSSISLSHLNYCL